MLAATPDTATNLEARAFLLRDDTLVIQADPEAIDAVLVSPIFEVALPIGRPEKTIITEALSERTADWSFVAEVGDADRYSQLLPAWKYEPARIAERPPGALLPEGSATEDDVRWIEASHREQIDEIEDSELRSELQRILDQVPMAAAFVEDRPVSFCSVYPETETRGDLAIDTLASYRRRGFARATAAFLIRHLEQRGIKPVWGALETNRASIDLAESLGFEWIGELGVWEAP